jgi:hypothetical protein
MSLFSLRNSGQLGLVNEPDGRLAEMVIVSAV